MKLAVLLMLLVCTISSSHTYAANPDSVWFAGQIVKIGSPKAKIFPRLAADYKLTKMADSDQWLVSTKESPPNFVGIILFEKEKVSFVNKDWGSYGEECNEAFQMLFQALSNISEQGNTIAILSVGETKEPQGSAKEIALRFGGKLFSISIVKPAGKTSSIGFSEQIGR